MTASDMPGPIDGRRGSRPGWRISFWPFVARVAPRMAGQARRSYTLAPGATEQPAFPAATVAAIARHAARTGDGTPVAPASAAAPEIGADDGRSQDKRQQAH